MTQFLLRAQNPVMRLGRKTDSRWGNQQLRQTEARKEVDPFVIVGGVDEPNNQGVLQINRLANKGLVAFGTVGKPDRPGRSVKR